MAFGGRQPGRAVRVLLGAILGLCLLGTPAFAQHGNGEAGRVPVDGVPTALQDDLKQLQREEPVPSSLFEARRQAERAAQVVATFLESEGYYQAEVEPHAEGVDTFTRGVTVTAGPLFTYASVRIDYLDALPDDTTRIELESLLAVIDAGVPARAKPVIDTGNALIARLRNAGYPDAKQDPVDALADADTSTVELTFKVRAGLRASFGKLSVSGLVDTKDQFIESLKPWKPDEIVTPAKLDEFRSRLAQTGLFSTATARLATEDPAAANGAAPRDVVVEVKERERRTIALGASASTSDGAGLDGSWELRNYSGWGDSLKLTGQIATLQRKLGATYTLPHIGKYGRILKVGTEVEDIETDAYDQTGAKVSASIEEQLTPRVRAALGVEAGYASILDSQAITDGGGRRDLIILSGSATAEYVGVRDILEPVNGIRARATFEPGLTTGDTNIVFGRITGEGSIYYDFGTEGNFVGALRGKLGAIVGPNGYPPDKAFFAGGGGSVRGYEYQSLSPRDSEGKLSGGRSLVEMSAELRYRANDTLGYVAFMDAGAAGGNVEPSIDSMSYGAGVGVRYYTGFGPLRADIAVPLNKKTGDADFQIYISIGQAF
ncbi:MAG: autotransporter assembly complex family protein [Hyphomonadaceae bacterium]